MNLTKEQIKVLKGKCPECQPYYDAYEDSERKQYKFDCKLCLEHRKSHNRNREMLRN